MRDQFRDTLHFEQRLALLDETRRTIAQMSADGIRPAYGYMVGDTSDQLKRVKSLYSLGAPTNEIHAEYRPLPEFVSGDLPISPTRRYDPTETGGAFNDFLWVASLAALFEDVDGATVPAEAVERTGMKDFLVDPFLGSLIEFREPSPSLQMEIISKFQGVNPIIRSHEPLKEAAELAASDRAAASAALTKYIAKDWYRLNSWTGWHGVHTSRRGSEKYSGYWCFEGAAVAKVFKLDDSSLETCKYYPWDLAMLHRED